MKSTTVPYMFRDDHRWFTRTVLCASLILWMGGSLHSQKIEKEVTVVKPYEPTLSDAFKINLMPDLRDSVMLMPEFDYRITTRPLPGQYTVRPIQAARMEAENLSRLYNVYLKTGFGNYVSPLLQVGINSLRQKNHSVGLFASHMSSNGKLKLANDQRVFAGYSDTDARLFGKKIFRDLVVDGDLSVNANTRYFYGYNTPDTLADLEKDDIRQRYLSFGSNLGVYSTHLDSMQLNYRFNLGFGYIQDLFSHHEESYLFSGSGSKWFANGFFGLDVNVAHYNTSGNPDSAANTIIRLHPWWTKTTDQYHLKVGLEITPDIAGETQLHIYPNATMQFIVIKHIMMPFIGVGGYLEKNSLGKIAEENYFIRPGLRVDNSDHKLEFYGGVKGNFSTRTGYTLKASYSLVDNMYFFVNDSTIDLGNQFTVIYDDAEVMNYSGEIMIVPVDRIRIMLKGNYYTYTLGNGGRAWHRPNYDLSFSAMYNLRDKILVHADLLFYGPRYAKSYDPLVREVKLKGFADINLQMEYRYTKIISGFIRINNLLASKYDQWNLYPAQRLFIMGGFTYSM